tara:strand:- start:20307 stop:20546 length:240 start_codon:yes stop_codon:yes gene_type:complete
MNPLNSFPADSPWHRTLMEHKPHLDMLMDRERLMEDIDFIIESFWYATWPEGQFLEDRNDLTRKLCDAVCRHFPATKPD